MRPAIVLVSGAPGAGKTTLATPLAAALGFALLSKDHIKETLHDAMPGPADDLPWSRKLGGASMELLWAPPPDTSRPAQRTHMPTGSDPTAAAVMDHPPSAIRRRCGEGQCRSSPIRWAGMVA